MSNKQAIVLQYEVECDAAKIDRLKAELEERMSVLLAEMGHCDTR